MSKSKHYKVRRTITNAVERWSVLILSVLAVLLIATSLFQHPSWRMDIVFLISFVGLFLVFDYGYQFLLPASFVMNDDAVVFKGTQYPLDELNTIAVTPNGNFLLILKDEREPRRIKPYNHRLLNKDQVRAWCSVHNVAFRHMGHSKRWWSD